MHTFKKVAAVLFALASLVPIALLSGGARAQSYQSSVAAPRIEGFDVQEVSQLVPGTELAFTLYGTPGGIASLRIAGVDKRVPLEETAVGVYEGSYTMRSRDRIAGNAAVTANLRLHNQVASAVLNEPLVAGAAGRYPAQGVASTVPQIDKFYVEPTSRIDMGSPLTFTVIGTPNATANVTIAGVRGKILLDEIRPGFYQGTYTVKDRDRFAANAPVRASLRIGDRDVGATLNGPLLASSAAVPAAGRARSCPNCGVVEAVNVVEVKGNGSYIGMIAGGLAGALLGSQVGQGRGTTAAEIAGAAAGAFGGKEIEARMKKTNHYEVVARLEGGGTHVASFDTQPPLKVGDRVRVEGASLVLDR